MPGQISNTSKRFSVTKPTRIKHLMVTTPQGPSGDLTKEARFAFNYSAKQTEREVSLTMPFVPSATTTSVGSRVVFCCSQRIPCCMVRQTMALTWNFSVHWFALFGGAGQRQPEQGRNRGRC